MCRFWSVPFADRRNRKKESTESSFCLALQVGADLLLGLAPFDAQYLAPHAAGEFRFLCALRLLFGGVQDLMLLRKL